MQILWEFFFSHVALSSARAWFDFPGWYYLSQSPFWVRLGCNLWADQRVVRKCGAQLPNFSFHHPSYSKLNLAHKSLLISTPILSIRRVCDIFELLLLTMMEMQVCRWQWHIRLIYTFMHTDTLLVQSEKYFLFSSWLKQFVCKIVVNNFTFCLAWRKNKSSALTSDF